jgi:GT2 family glycosyltransferase
MDKPNEYVLLFPTFPHGQWATSFVDARNSLVKQAQQEGAKYLLMMDTDQVYPADTFNKLMSNMDKCDICGVRVHRRWMPFDLIFYRGTLGKYKVVEDEEAFSGRLIDVDATGTGCLLFNMEVFDKVNFPWFQFTQTDDGKPVGEDIFFCSKAREAGVKICVDTSIVVGHLTTLEINEVLYKICKQLKKET